MKDICDLFQFAQCIGSSLGFSGAGRIVGDAVSEYLEIGAYAVIIGVIFALIAQIISSLNDIVSLDKTEKDYSFITTKDGKKGWCLSSCIGKN